MAAVPSDSLRQFYAGLLYGGMAVLVLGLVLHARSDDPFSMVLIVAGLALMVGGQVCGGMLLYRAWHCVERHRELLGRGRRTTDPAAAVALTYVPLVNLVGVYISLGRLPGELNAVAKRCGAQRRVPDGLGYLTAALFTATLIPLAGVLFGVTAGFGCMPMLLLSSSQLVDDIDARFESRAAVVPPVAG